MANVRFFSSIERLRIPAWVIAAAVCASFCGWASLADAQAPRPAARSSSRTVVPSQATDLAGPTESGTGLPVVQPALVITKVIRRGPSSGHDRPPSRTKSLSVSTTSLGYQFRKDAAARPVNAVHLPLLCRWLM